MSMLAGPRRKQKLSADPRGNAWSKDESKFGHKLLEKFGWSKGKGLGANEDGNVDHVKISLKNDTRGVGCSRSHEDNWIAHQDDFNDLLSSLNQDVPEKDTHDDKESDKVTGLEKKSKASRSRVHYQKFTKGKDLSSRSREDMACIFGRRKIKPEADLTPSSEDDDSSSDSPSKTEHGVITVRSTDSVQDYFAKKMAERKAAMVSQDFDDKSEDETPPGFGIDTDTINSDDVGKIKKKVRFSLGDEDEEVNVDTSKTKKKKSKKNRKSKDNEESIGETARDTAEDDQGEIEEDCNNRDSNKSPRKRKHASESQVDDEVQAVKSKKLKKSKKRKTESHIDNENTVETIEANLCSVETSDQIESETKLAKRKQEKLLSQTQVESGEESQVKSKKMKKSKKAAHFLTEEKCSLVQVPTSDTQDSGNSDSAGSRLVNEIESVKIETSMPNIIQSKLRRIEKARKLYVLAQKSSDSGKPLESRTPHVKTQKSRNSQDSMESKTDVPLSQGQKRRQKKLEKKPLESKTDESMSNRTQRNTKRNKKSRTLHVQTQKSSGSQELVKSKTDVPLSQGQKRRRKKQERKATVNPGGYLGYCTKPSDWQLNAKSKKVVNQVEKSGQAFSGSNCMKVIGYGKDSTVVLANKIVQARTVAHHKQYNHTNRF